MIEHRFKGIVRPYTHEEVKRLQGRTKIEHSLAKSGAEKLWKAISRGHVRTLGASTGNMAVQYVKGGLEAIYVSGWQVAADANLAGQTYPDQSLYPSDSVPSLVKRINNALLRAEQIDVLDEKQSVVNWLVPLVADAEAGFGGPLNAFEMMKAMIEAGAAGVHFEDQLSSAKKCGHLGGKVLVPTGEFIRTLVAARLAADVMEVPTFIIARTDAESARLITSDIDERDHPFVEAEGIRTTEGFWKVSGKPIDRCVARALAYAPYADMLWFETSTPDIEQAKEFATRVHEVHPGKPLAYNCSPSFNWKKKLNDEMISKFQDELASLGYVFQFVTLAGFHTLSHSSFTLAKKYKDTGMMAYAEFQEKEFEDEAIGYTATRHQSEVGTGYYDAVSQLISKGSSTLAMEDSTEKQQFSEQFTQKE